MTGISRSVRFFDEEEEFEHPAWSDTEPRLPEIMGLSLTHREGTESPDIEGEAFANVVRDVNHVFSLDQAGRNRERPQLHIRRNKRHKICNCRRCKERRKRRRQRRATYSEELGIDTHEPRRLMGSLAHEDLIIREEWRKARWPVLIHKAYRMCYHKVIKMATARVKVQKTLQFAPRLDGYRRFREVPFWMVWVEMGYRFNERDAVGELVHFQRYTRLTLIGETYSSLECLNLRSTSEEDRREVRFPLAASAA